MAEHGGSALQGGAIPIRTRRFQRRLAHIVKGVLRQLDHLVLDSHFDYRATIALGMRNLRVQLLLSHLLLVVLFGAAISIQVREYLQLGDSLDRIVTRNTPELLEDQRLEQALSEQEEGLNDFPTVTGDQASREFESTWPLFTNALIIAQGDSAGHSQELLVDAAHLSAAYASEYRKLLAANREVSKPVLDVATKENLAKLLHEMRSDILEVAQRNGKAVQTAADVARRQITDTATLSLWGAGLTFVLAVSMAYVIVGIVLKPLHSLSKRAESIGKGNFGDRVQVNRSDEIGVLATTFNTMSDRLDRLRRLEMDRVERAEQTTHLALTFLFDPVIVTDTNGWIVFLNRAAEEIWGPTPATPQTPMATHPYDLRILHAIQSAVHEGVSTGSGPDAPVLTVPLTGVTKAYLLHASPLLREDGVNLGCVAVLQDVTHLKELDRLKTEFIGVASHELRSPIQSLLLSAQLLEEGCKTLTAEQQELVATQLKDLERLDRLTRDLLDLSKLEAGRSAPRLEPVAPGEFLRSTAAAFRKKVAAKSITISLEEMPNLPHVMADRLQIQRVLDNLVDNAVRHSPAGGTVKIRTFSLCHRVTFLVEDDGEGIPSEYLHAILERFVQVPGATSGGAGLGLSIAQTILRGHGAELRVQSEAGHGSSFSFELETADSAGKEPI